MPSFSYKNVIKKLKKLGFTFHRQGKGSHEFWINKENGKIVMLAKHQKDFPIGLIVNIAKQLGFKNIKEFENFK